MLRQLVELVEANPRETTRILASALHCSPTTIANSLHSLGKTLKLDCWVPHELTQRDHDARCEVCTQLLSRSRRFEWLDNVLTGDEKWCLYMSPTHVSASGLALKKSRIQKRNLIFTHERSCSVYGGTFLELCIGNCCHPILP